MEALMTTAAELNTLATALNQKISDQAAQIALVADGVTALKNALAAAAAAVPADQQAQIDAAAAVVATANAAVDANTLALASITQ